MIKESRKKLTDVQFRQLSETQAGVAQARAILQKTELDAQRVIQLVFDAHGVSPDWRAEVDNETGELVCRAPDEKEA